MCVGVCVCACISSSELSTTLCYSVYVDILEVEGRGSVS